MDDKEFEQYMEQVKKEQPSPTEEANGDDLSDMFIVPKHDDLDMDVSDLVRVDLEDDVMDGDLSDLVDVSEEDVMGEDPDAEDELDEMPGTTPDMRKGEPVRYKLAPQYRPSRYPQPPPTSLGGVR